MAQPAPIRLSPGLLERAAAEATRQKRTPPKQIEFWAELGQALDGLLTREQAIELQEGLLRLVPADTPVVDADEVFASLDATRTDGRLSRRVTGARVVYQASKRHPGLLEQIRPDGDVVLGRFENGAFRPAER